MGAPSVMRFNEVLKDVSSVAFDTAPIIYFVEANPKYDAIVTDIFHRVENGNIIGFTSVISLCEVLVQPIRGDNKDLQTRYREILINSPNFFTRNITSAIAELPLHLGQNITSEHQMPYRSQPTLRMMPGLFK